MCKKPSKVKDIRTLYGTIVKVEDTELRRKLEKVETERDLLQTEKSRLHLMSQKQEEEIKALRQENEKLKDLLSKTLVHSSSTSTACSNVELPETIESPSAPVLVDGSIRNDSYMAGYFPPSNSTFKNADPLDVCTSNTNHHYCLVEDLEVSVNNPKTYLKSKCNTFFRMHVYWSGLVRMHTC